MIYWTQYADIYNSFIAENLNKVARRGLSAKMERINTRDVIVTGFALFAMFLVRVI